MTLQINISRESEDLLRRRADEQGRQPEEYASELVERALAGQINAYRLRNYDSPEVQARLRETLEELLKRAENLVPDPNRPKLSGIEAEFEKIVVEKYRRQGLQL